MKLLHIAFGITAMTFASNTFGQVEIQKRPLSWEQARLTEGEDLYIALCASCHGKSAKGDGPVSTVLNKKVPDLTLLAAVNDGEYPFKEVDAAITGKSRIVAHGTIEMPIWGAALEGVRPDWKMFRREALAKQRIHNITEYLSTIQSDE
jgi:mono/diheme cytochrome c family protein